MNTISENVETELAIIAGILLLLAAVIATGKGDWLIRGYNTASPEKKATYILPRLRGLTISILLCCDLLIALQWYRPEQATTWITGFIVIVIIGSILQHTWCRKRTDNHPNQNEL